MGRAVVSYVTGSHSAKVGLTWRDGWTSASTYPFSSNLGLQLLSGVPASVVLRNRSVHDPAQRERRHGHLCPGPVDDPPGDAHGGVRFDYFNSSLPALSADATRFVGARSFAPIENVPNWKDVSPRAGRVVRPVWDREDRNQGHRQPLRDRLCLCLYEPDQSLVEQRQFCDARLERRRERQPEGFHSAGRSAEPAAERRVHGDDQPALRHVGRHDAV